MITAATALPTTAPGQPGKSASPAGGEMFAQSLQAIGGGDGTLPPADPARPTVALVPGIADDVIMIEPVRQAPAAAGTSLPVAPQPATDPALAWLPAVNIPVPAPLDLPPAPAADAVTLPAPFADPTKSAPAPFPLARPPLILVPAPDQAGKTQPSVSPGLPPTLRKSLPPLRDGVSTAALATTLPRVPATANQTLMVDAVPGAAPQAETSPVPPAVAIDAPTSIDSRLPPSDPDHHRITRPAAPSGMAAPKAAMIDPTPNQPPVARSARDATTDTNTDDQRDDDRATAPSVDAQAVAVSPIPVSPVPVSPIPVPPISVPPVPVQQAPTQPTPPAAVVPPPVAPSPTPAIVETKSVAAAQATWSAARDPLPLRKDATAPHAADPSTAPADRRVPEPAAAPSGASGIGAPVVRDAGSIIAAQATVPVQASLPMQAATTMMSGTDARGSAPADMALRPAFAAATPRPANPAPLPPPAIAGGQSVSDGTKTPRSAGASIAVPTTASPRARSRSAAAGTPPHAAPDGVDRDAATPRASGQPKPTAPDAIAAAPTTAATPRDAAPALPPATADQRPVAPASEPARRTAAPADVRATPGLAGVTPAPAPAPAAAAAAEVPTPSPTGTPRPSFMRELPAGARQSVALRPRAAAPLQPVAGTTAPAAQVFGAAMHAAAAPDDRSAREPGELIASPVAPLLEVRSQPAPTIDAAQPTLDMRGNDWPAGMISHIESLRDAADANDTRIRLVPDALGAIAVTVKTVGDALHVHFLTDEPATRALIEDAQPKLVAIAEERGIRIGQSVVESAPANSTGTGQPNGGQTGGGQSQPGAASAQQASSQAPSAGTGGQQTAAQAQTGQQQPRQQQPSTPRTPASPNRAPSPDRDAATHGRIA